MKKLIFLLTIFITFISVNSYSQRFRAGLIGGLTATDLNGADQVDNDNDFGKAGFTGGGFVNAKLADETNSVQFEIIYVQKGHSERNYDTTGNLISYYKLNLDYIEVPVLFRHQLFFNVNKKEVNRFALEFGPSFGTLVRIKQDGLGYIGGNFTGGTYRNDSFRKTETALNIGVCYTVKNNLFFDVRYTNSIVHVVKQAQPLPGFLIYTFNKGNNMVFAFTLRYLFGAGGNAGSEN